MNDHQLPDAELIYDIHQIKDALDKLAITLNQRFRDIEPVVICLMNGGLIFTGNLVTRFSFMCDIDYMHVSRYHNETTGSELEWIAYPKQTLAGRVVLILDDILDEGYTLQAVERYCLDQGAVSVEVAVLLKKKHERCVYDLCDENFALEVDDRYVFGYGMDYDGKYRHLDSIYALKDIT